jgi:hypothetical protein
MFEKDKTFTGLARKFAKKLRRPVWPETVSRTAYGKPGYEQRDLRELIAKELGLEVDDLPRYLSKKAAAALLKDSAQTAEARA